MQAVRVILMNNNNIQPSADDSSRHWFNYMPPKNLNSDEFIFEDKLKFVKGNWNKKPQNTNDQKY